uniref:Uncharacterized protein n=1 Tax=Arundo donax TaxID=35708 RepID=A0A0A8Y525_ARUDO
MHITCQCSKIVKCLLVMISP